MTLDTESSRMALGEILEQLRPIPSAYVHAARLIEGGGFDELATCRVALLATFTIEVLRPYLIVEGASRGFFVRPYVAPFDQLEQQIFDGRSALYASQPDVVVLATRLEEMLPRCAAHFLSLTPAALDAELAAVEQRLRQLVQEVRRHTDAAILLFNYAPPLWVAAGLADASLATSQTSFIQRANDRLAAVCRATTDAYVFDYARLVVESGLTRWEDPKLSYLGRIPFGADAQAATARSLARYVRALRRPPCKCLVLDLDNTLWGGVLADDGFRGIALGQEYPGSVFTAFQRHLLALRDRGVMLAVASKNHLDDALEVLQRHPDCLLKPDHFASLQIHWEDKATSVAAIARELNLATDALAFFDDSPVERAWVRSQLPEVTVIEVPADPMEFSRALETSGAFDQLLLVAEDRARPAMYQHEQARRRLQTSTVTLEEFLQQLRLTVTVGPVTHETLPRAAQLLAKTNQFNLTARRHTAADLGTLLRAGSVALWLRAADRFGDYGLVGVTVAMPEAAGRWRVDAFVLSCRVMGRRIETAFLSVLSDEIHRRGGRSLLGEYLPSSKNALVASFYPSHGFTPVQGTSQRWQWDLSQGPLALPASIQVMRPAGDGT